VVGQKVFFSMGALRDEDWRGLYVYISSSPEHLSGESVE